MQLRVVIALLVMTTLGSLGCSKKDEFGLIASCTTRVSPTFVGTAESAICTTTSSYTAPVTITVSGRYQKRVLSTVAPVGLGAASSPLAIRYAEVRILNERGQIVQCGTLNSSGNAVLAVPQAATSYTVQIYSRGDNSFVKASVLNCPEENKPYVLNQTFVPDSNKTVTVTAGVTGSVLGGGFNIFDQIVEANNFLRSEVGSCPFTGCLDFTVAPKVTAYWSKGFNPNEYQGAPSSGISFYIPGFSRLFILGGILGDTETTDTDHFDDPVIIHEYGHFLEDVLSRTDSPGGPHSGNAMIDPRLAWSEGWSNFFQGAVRNVARYADSFGNTDGTTGLLLNIPIDSAAAGCTIASTASGCDLPAAPIEGNFREFAITRFLWDVFSAGHFDELWTVLTWTSGFKNSAQNFRNMGLWNEVQTSDVSGSTDLASLRTNVQNRTGDTREYARYVAVGACADYSISPVNSMSDNGSFATSNLFHNNDFFFLKHSGGPLTVALEYTVTDSGPAEEREPDLDLYIYSSSARLGNASDIVGASQEFFDNNQTSAETESISTSLPAGDYLVNVKVYTGTYTQAGCIGNPAIQVCQGQRINAGAPSTYNVRLNGSTLCPAARP
jgi:hypothetical protein